VIGSRGSHSVNGEGVHFRDSSTTNPATVWATPLATGDRHAPERPPFGCAAGAWAVGKARRASQTRCQRDLVVRHDAGLGRPNSRGGESSAGSGFQSARGYCGGLAVSTGDARGFAPPGVSHREAIFDGYRCRVAFWHPTTCPRDVGVPERRVPPRPIRPLRLMPRP
jgi:hypothetical protein